MLPSIFFYNVVLIVSLASLYIYSNSNSKQSRILFVFSFLPIFIVSAIRVGIGTDFGSYEEIFNAIKTDNFYTIEPSFYLLNKIISTVGLDFKFLIIATSFLFCYPILKCADRNVSIWVVFYIMLHLYLVSFNAIRQGISLSISCYALYRLFFYNEKWKFLILIIVSSTFHYSGLIGLVLLPAKRIAMPTWLNIIFLTIFYTCLPYIFSIVMNSSWFSLSKYAFYIDSDYAGVAQLGSGFGVLVNIAPFLFIILFNKRIFGLNENANLIVNISMIYIIIKLLALQMSIFYRFEYTAYYMAAIVFGEIARLYKRSHLNYILFLYIAIWSVLQFEIQLLNGANEVVPYSNYFGIM